MECCVCYSDSALYTSCNHMLCSACLPKIKRTHKNKCPVCRQKIKHLSVKKTVRRGPKSNWVNVYYKKGFNVCKKCILLKNLNRYAFSDDFKNLLQFHLTRGNRYIFENYFHISKHVPILIKDKIIIMRTFVYYHIEEDVQKIPKMDILDIFVRHYYSEPYSEEKSEFLNKIKQRILTFI